MKTKREIVKVPIGSLIPCPRNDRIHDQRQLDAIAESLNLHGQTRPILARAANKMIIAGHGVFEAAQNGIIRDGATRRRLDWQEIEVIFLDVNQATADQILIADNRTAELGGVDAQRRAALLADVDEEVLPALGFLPEEILALLGDGDDEDIVVREVETSDVDDSFWISVRGPLALQAQALQRLQEVMAAFPEIEVELGTVADG